MSQRTSPSLHAARLEALRAELLNRGVAGFVVPRADEYQNEYVPPSAQRLAWLTGFTGSAGLAAVLPEAAAVFADGRYTLQVREEVDQTAFAIRHITEQPLREWLAETLQPGQTFGYDPWLHTESQVRQLKSWVAKAGGSLVALETNPLDAVWQDRPPPPRAAIVPHPIEFTGISSEDKRAEIGRAVADAGAEAVVLTAPDSIAWLLNVRGRDVPCTPLPLSFAVLHHDGDVAWYVDPAKLSDGLVQLLGSGVSVHVPEEFGAALDNLDGRRVLIDPAAAPAWACDRLRAAAAEIVEGADPCQLPKACKNQTELNGTRAAHLRDGAALTRFLAWLGEEAPRRAKAGGVNAGVTEIEAAEKLADCRSSHELFRDFSFETIAGSGPNGAIVHYRVTPQSNRPLGLGELFLCDSGAQYPDGTTDVTRTIAVGAPSDEMRTHFTLVLKGHIALATVRFPKGTTGSQLDSLARYPLWQHGLDYDHGTGHGVGSYLSVHEGPQRISKLPNTVPLEPGMICSNEPGYYKPGAYGIRIENLVAVVESEPRPDDEIEMLAFETLTLAPIDRRLVRRDLLTTAEVAWLDAYHARVRDSLTDGVDQETKTWLAEVTRPLADG